MSMDQATPNHVKYAALFLISIHGKTTSLHVKQLIRNQGLYLNQTDTSNWLRDISDELPLQYNDHGRNGYLTYTLPTPAMLIPSNNTSTVTPKVLQYTSRDGNTHDVLSFNPNDGREYWEITSTNASYSTLYMLAANVSRDVARGAYVNINDCIYNQVRAKRIS